MKKKGILAVALLLSLPLVALPGCNFKQAVGNVKQITAPTFYDNQLEQVVTVGDIDIAYKSFGSGDPLVMITGYSTTMDTWDPRFLETLATQYRVIVFDNRGMGDTTAGTVPFTIDQFGADTAGLIAALGYEKANVLGWSIGGDIALSLVVNYPERVSKLISYAGDCGGPQKIPAPDYKKVLQDLQNEGVDATGSKALAALFPGWYILANPDYWLQFPWPSELSSPQNIKAQNDAYESWAGVYDQLPGITRPVLVATGTLDVSTPPGNADILAARIPGMTRIDFVGAGHGLQYMYPYDFAYAILTYLSAP